MKKFIAALALLSASVVSADPSVSECIIRMEYAAQGATRVEVTTVNNKLPGQASTKAQVAAAAEYERVAKAAAEEFCRGIQL